jgi:hypothetical protein
MRSGAPPKTMIVEACDFIDLQAGIVRVGRARAERILKNWSRANDLTSLERVLVLHRFDPPSA